MSDLAFLQTPSGRRIAYRVTPGAGPGVVFLGGFRSDMDGTKAVHLETWAKAQGRAFLRFDYSGHGSSDGAFEDGTISAWAEDAVAVVGTVTEGPQILVGSSMGGWIALLVARALPDRVTGFVGIAAAPDFTRRMWEEFTLEQKAELRARGRIARPSDYGEPYVITAALIEDGRGNSVLDAPLDLPFPVRLLQGTADADVPHADAVRLLEHVASPDARCLLVKGADHRFSTPGCLSLIAETVAAIDGSA